MEGGVEIRRRGGERGRETVVFSDAEMGAGKMVDVSGKSSVG